VAYGKQYLRMSITLITKLQPESQVIKQGHYTCHDAISLATIISSYNRTFPELEQGHLHGHPYGFRVASCRQFLVDLLHRVWKKG